MKKKLEKVEQEDKYLQRNEWEVEISDLQTARQMLIALGFEKEFIMEKYRKKFILPTAEITIDRLPFGIFAEIEASKDEINRLTKLLRIKASQRITVTYWDLHDKYNIRHHLLEENIVF